MLKTIYYNLVYNVFHKAFQAKNSRNSANVKRKTTIAVLQHAHSGLMRRATPAKIQSFSSNSSDSILRREVKV